MAASKKPKQMLTEISWEEFRDSGLFWLVNMNLHLFGMALVLDSDPETGKVRRAFPARTVYRGFEEKDNDEGYLKVSEYMKKNATQLVREAK